VIDIVGVDKSFGMKKVLKNVTLDIRAGETFVIIGQSGSGKTVILKHIAGFLDPDAGTVLIDGKKMNGASASLKNELRQKMGFLFQFGALINWLTVKENVALPLAEHKVYPPEKINEKVDEILSALQLSDSADKMPDDLSGGMKKRVGIARAMVRNPQIILYDEPTSGLDPVMSTRISHLIKKMQTDYGITSIVVTHDMASAYYVADRIAVLYRGNIIGCGSPDEIKNSEDRVVRQFINGELTGPIDA
jgi:phospholipid/cholesterol/gamma-HCH transport system ATP-binding protein